MVHILTVPAQCHSTKDLIFLHPNLLSNLGARIVFLFHCSVSLIVSLILPKLCNNLRIKIVSLSLLYEKTGVERRMNMSSIALLESSSSAPTPEPGLLTTTQFSFHHSGSDSSMRFPPIRLLCGVHEVLPDEHRAKCPARGQCSVCVGYDCYSPGARTVSEATCISGALLNNHPQRQGAPTQLLLEYSGSLFFPAITQETWKGRE